ncbi:hypothetical protein [Vibrio harveyi]|uniref:hypothetical protein n=1 Tax=Vibrio harveyi TaxID=669 RepID=UPI00247FC82C|nr:hypothetical protein [Vibrio harveyi]
MANIIEITPQCGRCYETNPAHRDGTERKVITSIKADGWIVKGGIFLCPDCIERGFQVAKGSIVRKST